jgi:pantoate--beta-alanine ligase
MQTVENVRDMHAWADQARQSGLRIGLVPTMGYLHEGHISLVHYAKAHSDRCVVSIFVNPLQFGPHEDLARYPRDLDRDRRMLEGAGVDVLYLPGVAQMYPPGFQTEVTVTTVTAGLCGRSRPGHFKGVTTVVAKLLNAVKPHLAVFGEKDFQQLVTIRRMVADLDLDVQIVGCPIVREADGLAMSSRNRYLSPEERQAARALSSALSGARDLSARGERRPSVLIEHVRTVLAGEPRMRTDYIELVDAETLQAVTEIGRPALLALAVLVGTTRLIDNTVLAGESLGVAAAGREVSRGGWV